MTYKYRNDRLFSFNVETVCAGQPRPYADSVSEFIVTDLSTSCFRDEEGNGDPKFEGIDDRYIEQFCVACIHPGKRKDLPREWWETYYTFEKISERKYSFVVTEPFTD